MRRTGRLLVVVSLIAGLMGVAGPAQAEEVGYVATGVITGGLELLPGAVGDPVIIRFGVDSLAADSDPATTIGEYSDALTYWNIEIGSGTYFATADLASSSALLVVDDGQDAFGVQSLSVTGAGLVDFTVSEAFFALVDSDGSTFASDDLTQVSPTSLDALISSDGPGAFADGGTLSFNTADGLSASVSFSIDAIGLGSRDSDGDGIEDLIDRQLLGDPLPFFEDQSDIFSDWFTDQHLGGETFGVLRDRAGLSPVVHDVATGGVFVEAAQGSGILQFETCGAYEWEFTAGDATEIKCGSQEVRVLSGEPKTSTTCRDFGRIEISARSGALYRIDGGSLSTTSTTTCSFEVSTESSESIEVTTADGDVFRVAPGEVVSDSADTDSDGIPDDVDNCPLDANPGQSDFDLDDLGDVCDPDDDNDGVDDGDDAFPFDPTESSDNDSDGIGDNADLDDDNDGQLDVDETACGSDPFDPVSKSPDFDQDGTPDCVDADDDNDGVLDGDDVCTETVIPDPVIPTSGDLGTNRYALTDGDTVFDTNTAQNHEIAYSTDGTGTTKGTGGCNATQIADALGLGKSHYEKGITRSVLESWSESVNG